MQVEDAAAGGKRDELLAHERVVRRIDKGQTGRGGFGRCHGITN
jgi:hypothetical protein